MDKFHPVDQFRKYAFTLAEVLITLGIIGIVAALTMPSLTANYQKQETVVRLKETYSLLSQALKKAELDNGPMINWGTVSSHNFCEQYLKPYLTVVKHYTPSELSMDLYCNSPRVVCNNYGMFSSTDKLLLKNGVLISPYPLASSNYSASTIIVDINGLKGPNRYGRDVFAFALSNGFLAPYGTIEIAGYVGKITSRDALMYGSSGKTCNRNGLFCAGVIMMDGWRIAPDYPW